MNLGKSLLLPEPQFPNTMSVCAQLSHLVALSLHPFHVCSEYYFLTCRGLHISAANPEILSYPILGRRMLGSTFCCRREAWYFVRDVVGLSPHLWLGFHLWVFFSIWMITKHLLALNSGHDFSSSPVSLKHSSLHPPFSPNMHPSYLIQRPRIAHVSSDFWVRFSAPLTDPGGSREESLKVFEGRQMESRRRLVWTSGFLRLNRTPVVGTCFMVKSEQETTVHEVCPLYGDTPVVFSTHGCFRTLARPTHNATYLEIFLSLLQDTHKPVTDCTHYWTDEQDKWHMYSLLPIRSRLVEEASTRRWVGFKMRKSSKWRILLWNTSSLCLEPEP